MELRTIINEIKNTLESINKRLDQVEEKDLLIEDRSFEFIIQRRAKLSNQRKNKKD